MPNNKAEYTKSTISSFQTSPGSESCILFDAYVSEGSDETVSRLLAFDIGSRALHQV